MSSLANPPGILSFSVSFPCFGGVKPFRADLKKKKRLSRHFVAGIRGSCYNKVCESGAAAGILFPGG
jgi:hypothetical protein